MKKTLLSILIFSLPFLVFSQKAESGNKTLEVQFSPLGSEPVKISGLRARYFLGEKHAVRASVFMGGKTTKTTTEATAANSKTTDKAGTFDFSFRPGYEYHLKGTKRLSPYFGGELLVGVNNNKNVDETNWLLNPAEVQSRINKTSSGVFGLNLIAGTDYYFAEKFYVGVEVGFGASLKGKGKTKVKYRNPENTSLGTTKTKGNSSEFNWGPTYQGTIRLGWCF
jgi:hypothetical protein